MKPRVVVITNWDSNRDRHCARLVRVLGDFLDIDAYSLESGLSRRIDCDVAIVPNQLVALKSMGSLLPGADVIVMKRTILRSTWNTVMNLPTGTRALLVDSNFETAVQYSAMLYELGASHLRLYPYDPEDRELPGVDIVLHPNEGDKVPQGFDRIVNLSNSEVDISTLVDVLSRVGALNYHSREALLGHLADTMPNSPGILALLNRMNMNNECLDLLMDSDGRGILAFDPSGRISMLNAKAREVFRPGSEAFFGLDYRDVLPRDLAEELRDSREVRDLVVEIQDRKYSLNKYSLEKRGIPIGGLLTLGEVAESGGPGAPFHHARSKGHRIKYSVTDIVGRSRALSEVVAFARKVALTDSDILIEGESGTGKELLTHVIHNGSLRRDGPFVAFNCAALSSSLLESELFGYEEGSFTGARKGGKKGMFELANGGTIFLDEIGEISMEIQTRLLRVLQEREIMRVGGTDLIPIDIRVVSSTNKNLFRMVREGSFREDLYFRLNVVSIRIPPLRERPEDIPYLVKYFLAGKGVRKDIPNEFMQLCTDYPWHGNVRELKNCIDYILNRDGGFTRENLPEYMQGYLEETRPRGLRPPSPSGFGLPGDPEPYRATLSILSEARELRRKCGRRSLAGELGSRGYPVSEQEARTILKRLAAAGFVSVGRGRAGTVITRRGQEALGLP